MRPHNIALSDYLSNKLQIREAAPNVMVLFRQRYWDHPEWYQSDIENEWYQLSNRVVSVEVQEDVEQFASSFTITLSDEEGELSPDNFTDKWPLSIKFRGRGDIVYSKQLLPNTEVKIFLGYGNEVLPFIHGFINETKINAENQTIEVSCMTSYKKLIHQTILPDKGKTAITAPTGNLFDVLKFFFNKAGVTLNGDKLYVPGTSEEWIIKGAKGERYQSYDEVVRNMIDTTFHYIRSEVDGSCTVMPVPTYKFSDPPDFVFDDGINITTLESTQTDLDIYDAVVVKCGKYSNGFTNSTLMQHVNLGVFKEEFLEVPWADTYRKRRTVAIAQHLKNLQKWHTINVGIVGDPRIQLWDVIGIRERVSSQTRVWHVKGIQTMISKKGFFQVLDLAPNYGYDTMPYSDLSPIQVHVDTIRLKVWDWDRQDGDRMNVYHDGDLVKADYMIKNNPEYIDIPLEMGNNVIVFEAITCALGIFTGRLQVLDTSNHILFDVGSLPDLTFPRVNVNKDGTYRVKPHKTWVVARV